jgi:ketosteroid isomerase-like protein
MVEAGDYVEAIEQFYAEDALMQENQQPPRRGRDMLAAHERKVLAQLKQMRTLPGSWFVVDGERVVIHWVFEWITRDGKVFVLDELAHQRWAGERIVEERFYFDPAQQRVPVGG